MFFLDNLKTYLDIIHTFDYIYIYYFITVYRSRVKMIPIIIAEKMVAVSVILCALVVGIITIRHGDVSLGLMVLLGQAQSLFGRQSHGIAHEAAHLAIHKKI